MAAPEFSSVTPQFPLNTAGTFGPNGMLVYGRFFTASGGMVAVSPMVGPTGIATGIKNAAPAGWPGMGATLVGTGRYNIMHPPATVLALNPVAATPSGVEVRVSPVHDMGTGYAGTTTKPGFPAATGITQIQCFATPFGTGGTQHINPPTGTRLDLFMYVGPAPQSGLTQF